MTNNNQRRCERYGFVLRVLYDAGPGSFCPATMYNYSDKGMYIETDRSLGERTTVYVKMLNYAPHSAGPESNEGYFARVCWEKRLARDEPAYGVGLEYGCKVRLR